MAGVVSDVASQISSQSATFAAGGFFFAAAIAWMDVVRYVISQLVSVPRNGGMYYILSAVFTTLLAVVVMMLLKRAGAQQPTVVYAVGR